MKKFVGIDLGTSNTFIYVSGKGIIFSEPTVIAYDVKSTEVLDIGYLAAKMIGRVPESIDVIKPVIRGVPSRMNPNINLLKIALRKGDVKSLNNYTVLFSTPCDITPIEKKALTDIAYNLGASDVIFENQAKLAALGAGLQIKENRGNMHINLGAGTTNIIVTSGEKILISKSSIFSGNLLDEAILRYLRKQRHLIVGSKTAEFIKMKIGSLESTPENRLLEVSGRDILTSLPHNVNISTNEVRNILLPLGELLIDSINDALILTPPELASDINENGVVISGGTSLLAGMREYIEKHINIPVRLAPDPVTSVVNGMKIYFGK